MCVCVCVCVRVHKSLPPLLSLLPRPPSFLPSIYVHNNDTGAEDRRKKGKAWEHSSHEWTRGGCGGGGADIIYLKVSFLPVKMSSFHHAKV